MNLERFCIKFFARTGVAVDDAIYIDIFHEWIKHHKLDGVLLDVADYRHVPNGPGIMLITHNINFAMDYAGGRFGLFAQRKQGQTQLSHPDKLFELVRATAAFGRLLESDPRIAGRLNLEAGAFQYQANDRLLAPNNAASYAVLQPDLERATASIYPGRSVTITKVDNDPRSRLTITVDSGTTISMQTLAEEVGVTG